MGLSYNVSSVGKDMKQKNWALLGEKFENERSGNQVKSNLAKFLKRRRLEMQVTLEQLSKGVCSTSYLSKIENGQVEVTDDYYEILFEKLDLNYSDVLNIRSSAIYEDLMRLYLYDKKQELTCKVDELIRSNYYCCVEVEIMVLLFNVINGSLKEAQKMLEKLVEVQASLTKEDTKMLLFVTTVYYMRTSQFLKAHEQVVLFEDFGQNDEKYQFACLDLMLDLYFELQKTNLFWTSYQKLLSNPLSLFFPKRLHQHQLQGIFLQSLDRGSCDFLRKQLEDFAIGNPEEKEDAKYYEALFYVSKGEYIEAGAILSKISNNPRVLYLKTLVVVGGTQITTFLPFLPDLVAWEIQDEVALALTNYAIEKLKLSSTVKLFSYLRNILINYLKNRFDTISNAIVVSEYQRVAMELGKYRDALRVVANSK